jgi:hypothetical protein
VRKIAQQGDLIAASYLNRQGFPKQIPGTSDSHSPVLGSFPHPNSWVFATFIDKQDFFHGPDIREREFQRNLILQRVQSG